MSAKTLTVVFTDIKGFTARTSRSSRAQMIKVLNKHEELLRPIILQHGGRVVKTIGDAFLLTFESPTNAVLCGVRMQARLRAYNHEAVPDERIDIRISMNTGEVELIGNDVFGETVNLASRVEGITDAGEVYFTESTYLVMNKTEVPTSQVGKFRFEGIPEQVTIYRVVQDENLDLYKQVVQSQAPAEPVSAAPSDVPEGAFSKGLLYSLEQQHLLQQRRRMNPMITVALTLACLAVLAGCYFGYAAYRRAAQRGRAAAMLADGQVKSALDLLAALRAERPSDPALPDLLSLAIEADVDELTKAERYEEALRRIEEHRERYPDLAVMDPLTRRTRLARALGVAGHDPAQARELMESLFDDYPQDDEIALVLVRHTARHFDLRRAMFLLGQILERDPTLPDEKAWTAEVVARYLERHYRDDDTLALIDRHYYDDVRLQLLERIGDSDVKDARRNAHALLSRHGDLTPVDEFRFFTAELFSRTIIERTFREETFAYFESMIADGIPDDIEAALPIALPPARVLNNGSPDRERALPIVQQLFPQALPE